MKTLLVLLALGICCAVNAKELNVETQALLIQELVDVQLKKEATPSGPIANIHSLAALGFTVTKISFTRKFVDSDSQNWCTVNIEMKRGLAVRAYSFLMITEDGFAGTQAAIVDGRKYSSKYSEAYRNSVKLCLEMTK